MRLAAVRREDHRAVAHHVTVELFQLQLVLKREFMKKSHRPKSRDGCDGLSVGIEPRRPMRSALSVIARCPVMATHNRRIDAAAAAVVIIVTTVDAGPGRVGELDQRRRRFYFSSPV